MVLPRLYAPEDSWVKVRGKETNVAAKPHSSKRLSAHANPIVPSKSKKIFKGHHQPSRPNIEIPQLIHSLHTPQSCTYPSSLPISRPPSDHTQGISSAVQLSAPPPPLPPPSLPRPVPSAPPPPSRSGRKHPLHSPLRSFDGSTATRRPRGNPPSTPPTASVEPSARRSTLLPRMRARPPGA